MTWKLLLLATLTLNLLLGQICPKTLAFQPPRMVNGQELMSHADVLRCPSDTQSHVPTSMSTVLPTPSNSPCADGRCLKAVTVPIATFQGSLADINAAGSIPASLVTSMNNPAQQMSLPPSPTESPPLRQVLRSIVIVA